MRSQKNLMTFIKLLFDWVFVRADFEEIEWYSIWCVDMSLVCFSCFCCFDFFLFTFWAMLLLFLAFSSIKFLLSLKEKNFECSPQTKDLDAEKHEIIHENKPLSLGGG